MCGIAGLIFCEPRAVKAAQVKALHTAIAHRGPDDYGWMAIDGDGHVSLEKKEKDVKNARAVFVQRRLSILDLSPAGWQPMQDSSGSLTVVYNGEIFNYVELRQELEAMGHSFRSDTDTEVLLAAWMRWGSGCLKRFQGMFAFALYDGAKRKVFLARDAFGIKPLFVTRFEGGFGFASEQRAILGLDGVDRSVNPQSLFDFLRFDVTGHGSQTMIRGIEQVEAAHYMVIDLDAPLAKPLVQRYWEIEIPDHIDRAAMSFDETKEELREKFLHSVRLHMRSDVPVGCALSGGLDSSSILCAMRYLEPDAELHAISYIPHDPSISEEKWIDIAAKHAGAKVHKVRLEDVSIQGSIETLVAAQGEPFGNAAMYAQYGVFAKAKELGLTVMMEGQGGDEMLSGYNPYYGGYLAGLIRRGDWGRALRLIPAAQSLPGFSALGLLAYGGEHLLPESLRRLMRRAAGRDIWPSWLNRAWFDARGVSDKVNSVPVHDEGLKAYMKQTAERLTLPHLLRYGDRNAMASSIENRVPFLTMDFANFMYGLPDEYFIGPDGVSKYIFREAMRGILPDEIVNRRDKKGFKAPQAGWDAQTVAWVDSIFNDPVLQTAQALNGRELAAEWARCKAQNAKIPDHLWRIIALFVWINHYDLKLS